jgi:hypothetical protein
MKFGWFPKRHSYKTSTISINPLPEFEDSVSVVRESGYVHEGWFCVPLEAGHDTSEKPHAPVPMPWFSLPLTHLIQYQSAEASSKLSEFLITVFGWSQGLLLQPEGWGHFYRVALEPGKLTDFILFELDVPRLLDLAEVFWHSHQVDGVAAKMFGAIHWFLFSQSYRQYFERFMMQYIVLDTIYKIQECITGIIRKSSTHAKRIETLANSLMVPLPTWGNVDSTGKSEISRLRNDLFHEARFGGAPIGFEFPAMHGKVLLQLKAFNCRLIAALLGAKGNYSRSSSQTRQVHRFSID